MNEPHDKPDPVANEAPPRSAGAVPLIEHAEDDGRGAFFVAREGVRLAQMTYTRAGDDLIIIDHTEVNDKLRGLGVARRLLDATVAWARATKTRVMATCPYARAQFDKDPSIRDVLAT